MVSIQNSRTRIGLEEENYSRIPVFDVNREANECFDIRDVEKQQTEPLLLSSHDEAFNLSGYLHFFDHSEQSKRNEGNAGAGMVSIILTYFPLILGWTIAAFLLFLAFVSYERPGSLGDYLGITQLPTNKTSTSNTIHRPTPSHVISYENYTQFPLLSSEYFQECNKLMGGFMSCGSYWGVGHMGTIDVIHADDQDDYRILQDETPVCTSSITYMLDGRVGLFADLSVLAQAAAMARERNRTLIVDDSYWTRGKWIDYFQDIRVSQPGPEPGCKAPPPEELVACPRSARHWVISSRTAMYHFGHEFYNNYEDPYGHSLNRFKPMYESAQESFRTAILPNAEIAALIQKARASLLIDDADAPDNYLAAHIRRGDHMLIRHDGERISTKEFIQAVDDSWARLHPEKSAENVLLYIASDSPYVVDEVLNLTQSRYKVSSLFHSEDPELRALASPNEYVQSEFDQLDRDERMRATRGVIVDFALLSGFWAQQSDVVPTAVVCTISSNICTLVAVGLSWERAFGVVNNTGEVNKEGKGWVEIDQNGHVWPDWKPFHLY